MSNLPVALLVITDGREDYLERTLASAKEMLLGDFSARIVVNDEHHTMGFAGAIQRGWEQVLDSGCRYVFHLEDDFIFNRPAPLAQMCDVLAALVPKKVVQLALKRQPWNDAEAAAGGVVELAPHSYEERTLESDAWGDGYSGAFPVTLHRRCFTTNPSLYPATLCERGWPQVENSEGVFTHQLLAEGYRFAYWGEKFGPPLVEHIGAVRAGHGY